MKSNNSYSIKLYNNNKNKKNVIKNLQKGGKPPKIDEQQKGVIKNNLTREGQYTAEQADTLLTEIEFIYRTNPLYFADKYDWIEFAISKFNLSEEQATSFFRSSGFDLIGLLMQAHCPILTYRSENIMSIRSMQRTTSNAQLALETLRAHNGNFDVISQKHKCFDELISKYRYNPDKAQTLIERHNNNFVAVLAEANAIQKIMETGSSLQDAESILVRNNYNYGLIFNQLHNSRELVTYNTYVDLDHLEKMFPDDIDFKKRLKFAKKMKSLSEQLMEQQSCTVEVSITIIKHANYDVEEISKRIFRSVYITNYKIHEEIIDRIITILKFNDKIMEALSFIYQLKQLLGLSHNQLFKIFMINTENYANIFKEFYKKVLELIGGPQKLPINIDVSKAFDIIFRKTTDPVKLAKFLYDVNRLFLYFETMPISIDVISYTYIDINSGDYEKTLCDLLLTKSRNLAENYGVEEHILIFLIRDKRISNIKIIEKFLQIAQQIDPLRRIYNSLANLEVFMNLCNSPYSYDQIILILNRKLGDEFKLNLRIVNQLLGDFRGDLPKILVKVYQRVASITEIEAIEALQEFGLNFAHGLQTLRKRLNDSIDAYNKGHSEQQSLASDFRSGVSMELYKDPIQLECNHPCSLWTIMKIATRHIPCPFCRSQLSVDQRELFGKIYNFPTLTRNKLAFKIILELRERLRGIAYYPTPPPASVQMSSGQLRNEEMESLDPEMFARVTELAVATRFGPDRESLDIQAETIQYFRNGAPFVQRIGECIRNMQIHCDEVEQNSRMAVVALTYVQAETFKNKAIAANDIVIANYNTAVHLRNSLELINRNLFRQCAEINDDFCKRSLTAVKEAIDRLQILLPAHQQRINEEARRAAAAADEARRAAAAENARRRAALPNIYAEDPPIINLEMPDPRRLSNDYQEIVRRYHN
jgi:hypothetical protein